jgi:hypothetical protein
MASNVVRATLLADAQRFKAGFRDAESATTSFEKLTGKAANLVKGYLAVQALGAVKAFVGDSIRAFSDLEQSTGAVESVFGASAEKIKKHAEGAADAVGLSAAKYQESAALIGSMLQAQGFESDVAADKTVNLVEKASDMAATFGGPVSDAVGAIGSLLRGETNPIERYGVSMKVADINARALEMGLKGTAAELDKNDKAMAALDILYEQTAKTAGQFGREAETIAGRTERLNAELENQKALLGESLAPLYAKWQELQADSIPILTDIATLLGAVTSKMEGNAEAAEEAGDKWGMLGDLWAYWTAGLGPEIRDTIMEWADATNEGTKKTTEAIGRTSQFADNIEIVNARTRALTDVTEEQTEAQEDLNRETATGIELAREAFDVLREQTDATYAVKGAIDDQAAAQKAVNDASAEFGDGSPEHLAALEDLSGANMDLRDAEMRLVEQGGLTREEFVNQQIALGLTRDQAELLAAQYDILFTPRKVTHTITVNNVSKGNPGRVPGRAGGGFVLKGNTYEVNEEDTETFTPSSNGFVNQNRSEDRGGNGSGSGGDVYLTIHAGLGSDPNAIGKAVLEALQRYQRQNGALPLRVRG